MTTKAPAAKVVVIFTDGGAHLTEGIEDEAQVVALQKYANLIQDVVEKTLEDSQFRHVEVLTVSTADEVPEDCPSALCIGFADDVRTDADGEQVISDFSSFIDIEGLVTGTAPIPASVADKVVSEDSILKFTDDDLGALVKKALDRARGEKLYDRFLKEEGEEVVQEAMQAAGDAALDEGAEPASELDLFSIIELAVAHVVSTAGVSPPLPSLLNRGIGLVGGLLTAPRASLRALGQRAGNVQRLWWRLEDIAVDGSKLAFKIALKAARPLLVGLVVHRALRTIDASRSLEHRLATLPPNKRTEYYYRRVLGEDWEKQLEEDMRKALAEVDEGLITEDIADEKRLVSAGMLRRLELEDWDKERMKNFYLASYGGLKWFEFMENALHNPLFITARGWTDPVENWVGRQQTFPNDLPKTKDGDVAEYALSLVEKDIGRELSKEEKARIVSRVTPRASDMLAGTRMVQSILPAPAAAQ